MTSESYIHLPEDQYRHHVGNVPVHAEWWWHIGTLRHENRVFGFEINAAGFAPKGADPHFLLAYIMLTDVQEKRHYQTVNGFPWNDNWAQADTTKPWAVNVGPAGQPGSIAMSADKTPLSMNVKAQFKDATFNTTIDFDLNFVAKLPPLQVFGDGRSPVVDPEGKTPLERHNFYYSFPKLEASGRIAINGNAMKVHGTTWMDHEYGAWPGKSFRWILQDITLTDGTCLSVFTGPDVKIIENQTVKANVTVLGLDGVSRFSHDALVTPLSPAWKSPSGATYFPNVKVEIPPLRAEFIVKSLVSDQEFWNPQIPGSQVYEGVAVAEGRYHDKPAHGTAWNEQHLFE
ncbi:MULTISPECIES: lipocalin-like domain-containing protein [unclassified Duganella]|uniref:lipocalin-like domain-containing protein n=1 Tax=unclassified Duganella TaxID=2636909 RepID=UPI000E351DD6|nr:MULTISPECIES: lipocalin-like domain-containing protein [unclassified Duganella]RFP10076.1 hypothetical protein D0T23_24095 [Duganella sp. BJB475]RFP25618.1 hypothetical protein D0T21_26515 [Duganella sp. BJB476]